jgi:hypothetical protein
MSTVKDHVDNRRFHPRAPGFLIFALLPSLGVCSAVSAAETEIRPRVKGTWQSADAPEAPSFAWRAQWIWMDEDVDSDRMLARRSFELPGAPEEARLRITATSQYELYVNGEYVCRGPARCAPHHQSFDVLDLAPLLGSFCC